MALSTEGKTKREKRRLCSLPFLSCPSNPSRSLPCFSLPPSLASPQNKQTPASNSSELPAIDATNQLLYCGDASGDIWEASLAQVPGAPSSPPRVLARTGGRPLSHALTADGSQLVFTDAVRGLLSLDLTQRALAPNAPLRLLSGYASDPNPATAASGPVSFAQGIALTPTAFYFSDTADAPPALPASPGKPWNAFGATRANLFSGKPTGRLLKYDPATAATTVVSSGFYVANGIALSSDGSAIILNESMSMRVLRIPLSGPDAGIATEFARSPGYLDSLSATPAKDGYWVCVFSLASQTIPGLSTALAASKPLRAVAGNLPESVTSAFIARGDGVMLLGSDGGQARGWLEDPDGSVVAGVSGVVQYGNKLLLTAFDGPIKVVDVPAFVAASPPG